MMNGVNGILKLVLAFCFVAVLGACAANEVDPTTTSKNGAASFGTPSNTLTGVAPTAGLIINCPTTATVGGAATCSASLSGTFASLSWTVNGVAQANGNSSVYTWTAISPAGTYRIQLNGISSAGTSVASNTIDVVVSNPTTTTTTLPTLTIVCPSTVAVGADATCTASASGAVVSGYWTVNGAKQTGSDNVYAYTWAKVPTAGTYKIQGVAFTSTGAMVKSNEVSVVVTATPLPLSISCPTTVRVGDSPVCTAKTTITFTSGYWLLNGTKVVGSDNLLTLNAGTLTSANIGTYSVQAIAFDSGGQGYLSNAITVQVLAK